MKLDTSKARSLVLLLVLLPASPLVAYETRSVARNSVTGNKGTSTGGNYGTPAEPSSANYGTRLEGNKGEAIPGNYGTSVEGNKGEAIPGNYGTTEVVYGTVAPGGDYDGGCCYDEPSGSRVGAGSSAPSRCVQVDVDGTTYEQCYGTYYAPSFSGTDTTYTESPPPR